MRPLTPSPTPIPSPIPTPSPTLKPPQKRMFKGIGLDRLGNRIRPQVKRSGLDN